MNKDYGIKSIVCMTEESVEFLHAIGRSELISGVSVYAVRPQGVGKQHPVISAFTHANIKKILKIKPDLVLGFSDIQKDIARDMIAEGLNVFISNQRSIAEIFQYMWTVGHMIGEGEKTRLYLAELHEKIEFAKNFASSLRRRPLVYIEEWDEPQICGISWFSELVELCGGIDIFRQKSISGVRAADRFVTNPEVGALNPDYILGCWCGKKVDIESIRNRSDLQNTNAIINGHILELPPEIFLQPGPALFVDGIDRLIELFRAFN